MVGFFRRGWRQIVLAVIQGAFIAVIVVGCALTVIDLYNDSRAESIIGLIAGLLILAGLLYVFVSLFRSYITFGSGEITVTANVSRNNPLVYKDQNAFTLRYDKITGVRFTERAPNPATFLRFTPSFLTLVLQTDGNDRYITLHYYSDAQIRRIIDVLNERTERVTGKRLTEQSGSEMLAEYRLKNKEKRGGE